MSSRSAGETGAATPCIMWTGRLSRGGYGRASGDRPAHRVAYEQAKGPIPPGLVIDHLCRNRACVNPEHMEPVTPGENTRRGEGISSKNARKTACPAGHPLSGPNLYRHSTGRYCRACNRQRVREYKQRLRAASFAQVSQ